MNANITKIKGTTHLQKPVTLPLNNQNGMHAIHHYIAIQSKNKNPQNKKTKAEKREYSLRIKIAFEMIVPARPERIKVIPF